jgi:hypothetical protein
VGAIRQPAVTQKKARFFEGGPALGVGEIVNVVALIRQNTAIAVEIANRRFAGDHIL